MAPHMMRLRKATGFGHTNAEDHIKRDGITDVYNQLLMGQIVEKLNTRMSISREDQDEYAIESFKRARKALEDKILDWETTPV